MCFNPEIKKLETLKATPITQLPQWTHTMATPVFIYLRSPHLLGDSEHTTNL